MAVTASILDVPSLVSQLMTIERRPIDKLNAKVTDYQSKISSFGTLSGLVSTLQTSLQSLKSSLEGYGVTPTDSTIFSATATSSAAAGSYTLNVTRLAQAQNLVAAGQASQTLAIPTIDSTVTFTIGGNPMDVTISAGATLQDIRAAINAADIGVTATIINDGSATAPYRLVLTADEAGASNGISSITVSGDSAVSSLLTFSSATPNPAPPAMSQSAAAQDASFTVNGIGITSATNTVTDAIQGVTLTLKSETTTAATLTVARDTDAIEAAAAKFVESYNALATQLKSLTAYGTDAKKAGVLAGDGAARQMLDQLRSAFLTPASGGSLSYLAEVGITTLAGGTLKLDNSKMSTALADDFDGVVNLFNGATGFVTRLDEWATSATQTGGLISERTQNMNSSIDRYQDQIERLELQMVELKRRYTTTYSNLNMMLSSMSDTSKYLTSQFG
jgi:flagellar hook-associated protein 2